MRLEPPPPLTFEDPVECWKREGTEQMRQRAAFKTAMRREEREAQRARVQDLAANDARLAALEQRLAAAERSMTMVHELARGCVEFSNAVDTKLHALEALSARLDATLTSMRGIHERECKALRDRLASAEAMHGRETALLTRQLADTQRELDRLTDRREREHDRAERATISDNIVALRRDLAERGGAA